MELFFSLGTCEHVHFKTRGTFHEVLVVVFFCVVLLGCCLRENKKEPFHRGCWGLSAVERPTSCFLGCFLGCFLWVGKENTTSRLGGVSWCPLGPWLIDDRSGQSLSCRLLIDEPPIWRGFCTSNEGGFIKSLH